ncbi:hypothetical protein BVRB_8g183030 [Beta vulgaris subsp. vulgaris]|uniref:VQ motif-containing protein 4 n=1 Tax=Beta vulgaris subsp. vulgaris TaxID=3555 RepID=UPI000540290C|nr:VQ motif-containing protein 4 [Beta vulgaris subsp. vulgaris]KMT04651.1 hypothetical protein BVRB_8g183030 [Beta vulgaris subsp. vulgaris]
MEPPHSLLPSPTSSTSSNTNNNTNTNNTNNTNNTINNTNNVIKQHQQQHPQSPLTRSETNPYPTTFVQADTSSFKQVVQMLTGSSTKPTSPNPIPPIKTPTKSKLYERRSTTLKNLRLTNNNNINNNMNNNNNNNNNTPKNATEILSPSILDFPSLALSPVTPLIRDPFNRSPPNDVVVDHFAEQKAIAEKGFFLHPSPVTTPRDSQPRLLPLFPVLSPRFSSPSNLSS